MAMLFTFIFHVPISNLQPHTHMQAHMHTHTSPYNVSHILNTIPNSIHTYTHTDAHTYIPKHTHNFIYLCDKIGRFSHIFTPPHSLLFSVLFPPPYCIFPTDANLYLAMHWEQTYTEKHRQTYAYTCTCAHTLPRVLSYNACAMRFRAVHAI